MIEYHHPLAQKILEDALRILKHSSLANRLLETLSSQPYTIYAYKTLYPRPFVPDESTIFIGISATQDFTDIEQVIDLAAALVELKGLREGNLRPAQAPLKEETLQKQHLMNLDIMLHTFPIVEELDWEGYKAIDAIRKQGFSALYRAWLRQADYSDYIKIYWAMF